MPPTVPAPVRATAPVASLVCYVSEPEPGGDGAVPELTPGQVTALLAAGYHVQAADAEARYAQASGRRIAEVLADAAA